MKTNKFLFAALVSILLMSCGQNSNPSDNSGGSTGQTGTGSMSAKVDGQDWSAATATAGYSSSTRDLTLNGARGDASSSSAITISLRNVQGTGTFTLVAVGTVGSSGQGFATYGTNASGQVQSFVTTEANAGTVTLTRFDQQARVVAGTFSFRCTSPTNATLRRNITEGRFEIPLISVN
ncbi:MAG: hypothetical protein ACK41G_09400 [Candidatus Thermochlorobacter sp.]